MSPNLVKVRMKRYIQPFEYELALRELKVLGNCKLTEFNSVGEQKTEFELREIAKEYEAIADEKKDEQN